MQWEPMKQTDLNPSSMKTRIEWRYVLPRKSGVNGNVTGNGFAMGCAIIVSNVFGSGKRS